FDDFHQLADISTGRLESPTARALVRGSQGETDRLESSTPFLVVSEQADAVHRLLASSICAEADVQSASNPHAVRRRRRGEVWVFEAQSFVPEKLAAARFGLDFPKESIEQNLITDEASSGRVLASRPCDEWERRQPIPKRQNRLRQQR